MPSMTPPAQERRRQQQTKRPAIAVLVNRLSSASLSSDALASLQDLLDVVRSSYDADDVSSKNKVIPSAEAIELASNEKGMEALSTLIASSYIERDFGGGRLVLGGAAAGSSSSGGEDSGRGPAVACEVVLALLGSGPDDEHATPSQTATTKMSTMVGTLLKTPTEGQLINAILERLCPVMVASSDSNDNASASLGVYPRLLALSILRHLLAISPSIVQGQLLAAPDGLNRIISLLSPSAGGTDSSASVPEEIRNDSLLLLSEMSRTSSNCARLIIFSEGYERALALATDPISRGGEGGLAGGNTSVLSDVLDLCLQLTRSVERMGAEVVLGSRTLLDRIGTLLDLRGGRRFRLPNRYGVSDSGKRKGSKTDTDEDDDDLDGILGGSSGNEGGSRAQGDTTSRSSTRVVVPRLSADEEMVVARVLELLSAIILESEDEEEVSEEEEVRQNQKKGKLIRHEAICRFLLDLALFAHPPPGAPYPHGAPSISLQSKALDTVALLARKVDEDSLQVLLSRKSIFLQNVSVTERLMYLICTGGGLVGASVIGTDGAGHSAENKRDLSYEADQTLSIQIHSAKTLSAHALSVLRGILRGHSASVMISHALAPPTEDDNSVGPSEVVKLVNTLAENLHVLGKNIDESMNEKLRMIQHGRTVVCATGAATALAVFLSVPTGVDAAMARDMLLRVPVPIFAKTLGEKTFSAPRNLIDCALHYLEVVSNEYDERYDPSLSCVLLWLILEWVGWSSDGASEGGVAISVLTEILSNPSSITLRSYFKRPPPGESESTTRGLAALVLGFALEALPPGSDVGGWTKDGIMTVLTSGKGNAAHFTTVLERSTSLLSTASGDQLDRKRASGPWSLCMAECKAFLRCHEDAVRFVRKRFLHEVLGCDAEDSDGDTKDTEDGETRASAKSLAKMASRQCAELEALRERLRESEKLSSEQERQLHRYRRRVESNPTELDAMLNDLSEVNDTLTRANKQQEELINEMKESSSTAASADSSAAIRAENSKLRSDVIAANEWMTMAVQRMDELAKKNAELDSLRSRVEEEVSTHISARAQLASTISSLKDELHRKGAELSTAKNDTAAAKEWMDNAIKRHASLVQEIQTLGTKNNELESDLQEAKTASQRCEELEIETEEMRNEIASLKNENKELCETIASFREGAKEENSEIKEQVDINNRLSAETESLQEENATAKKNLQRASKEKSEIEASMASIKADFVGVRRNEDMLTKELDEVRSTLSRALAAKQSLREENEKLVKLEDQMRRSTKEESEGAGKEAIDLKMKRNMDEARASLEFLSLYYQEQLVENNVNNILDKDEENFRNKLETADRRIVDLETALTDTKHEVSRALARVAQLEGEMETLEQENANLKISLEAGYNKSSGSTVTENNKRIVKELEADLAVAQEQLHNSEKEISSLAERSEDVVSEWKQRADELEMTIENLEAQIKTQEAEAEEAITEWQGRCSFLEAEVASSEDTEKKLRALAVEAESYKERVGSNEILIDQLRKRQNTIAEETAEAVTKELDEEIQGLRLRISQLETENGTLVGRRNALEQDIKVLEQQRSIITQISEEAAKLRSEHSKLKDMCAEREVALLQSQKTIDSLQSELAKIKDKGASETSQLKHQVETLEKALLDQEKDSEGAISLWEDAVKQLEAQLGELQNQFDIHQKEADEAIDKWENQCSHLELTANAKESSLKEKIAALECSNSTSETANEGLQAELLEKEAEILLLAENLLAGEKQSEIVVKQWQERAEALEFSLNELESSMEEQQIEANTAIEAWEEQSAVLNNRISKLEDIGTMKQAELQEITAELDQCRDNLQKAIDDKLSATAWYQREMESTKADLAKLSELEKISKSKIQDLVSELDEKDKSLDHEKNVSMQKEAKINSFEEINQALKLENAKLTEHVGELQAELRDAIDSIQSNFTDDVTGVATDSLYVQMLNIRDTIARGQNHYDAPRDNLAPTEFEEYRVLYESLQRIKEEFMVTRSKLQTVEKSAACANAKVLAIEEEARLSKRALSSMKLSVVEARKMEADMRESMEHQLRRLKADSDVRTRSAHDAEGLTIEVTVLRAERDRLLHALGESERANAAALVFRDVRDDGSIDDSDLKRLRLENSQLLLAVEKGGKEREIQVNTAVAAASSLLEANIILEREEREMAEAADTVDRRTATDTRSNVQKIEQMSRSTHMDTHSQFVQAQNELAETKRIASRLEEENLVLKAKCERSEMGVVETIRRLKERCHNLERKVGNGKGSFESAVAAEVSCLRGSIDNGRNLVGRLSTEEICDSLIVLKSAVGDERQLYRDLVTEHNDLLGLTAQFELEIDVLRNVLSESMGPDAVTNATREVELRALSRFGKYVQL